MWLYLYFSFGKFQPDIQNKMVGYNGTYLSHVADFDIG